MENEPVLDVMTHFDPVDSDEAQFRQ